MNDSITDTYAGLILLVIVLFLVGAYGKIMYGQWRCGFVECRVVVEASP